MNETRLARPSWATCPDSCAIRSGPPSSSVPRVPEIIWARPVKVSCVMVQVCVTPPRRAAGTLTCRYSTAPPRMPSRPTLMAAGLLRFRGHIKLLVGAIALDGHLQRFAGMDGDGVLQVLERPDRFAGDRNNAVVDHQAGAGRGAVRQHGTDDRQRDWLADRDEQRGKQYHSEQRSWRSDPPRQRSRATARTCRGRSGRGSIWRGRLPQRPADAPGRAASRIRPKAARRASKLCRCRSVQDVIA